MTVIDWLFPINFELYQINVRISIPFSLFGLHMKYPTDILHYYLDAFEGMEFVEYTSRVAAILNLNFITN